LHEVIITEQNDAGSPIKTANPTKGGKLSEDTAPVLSILQKLVDIKQKNAETTKADRTGEGFKGPRTSEEGVFTAKSAIKNNVPQKDEDINSDNKKFSKKDHPALEYREDGDVKIINPDAITMAEWGKQLPDRACGKT
jgi:hypothetical protein